MNTKFFLSMMLLTAVLSGCGNSESKTAAPEGEAGHDSDEGSRGPHGGRLLEDGSFTLELAIFEAGVPPEFRAWAALDGKPLAPDRVQLTIALERLGGVIDRIEFAPQEDFLRSTSEVYEPHSFAVSVEATSGGAVHRWTYDAFEGRTTIPAETAKQAGVVVEVAGPGTIAEALSLYGAIAPDPEKVRTVTARYPGIIRSVRKSLGDAVRQGDVLAQIESNESLRSYDITAPIAGVVTLRNANPGENSADDALFTVTDLSRVVAELSVFPRDVSRIKPGQRARIRAVDGGEPVDGDVVRVSPAGAGANQALKVRVALDNADGRWTPGRYVTGEVMIGTADVPVAIRADSVQRLRDGSVAFENVGDIYEARPVELGRSDGEWVEVTAGLASGARYVAQNSFLVKADIEKSGASHDH